MIALAWAAVAGCRGSGTEVPRQHTADVTVTVEYEDTFAPRSTAPVAVVAIIPTSPHQSREAPVVGGVAVLTFPGVILDAEFYEIAARVLSTTGGAERGGARINCVRLSPPSTSLTVEVQDGAQLETVRRCAARR